MPLINPLKKLILLTLYYMIITLMLQNYGFFLSWNFCFSEEGRGMIETQYTNNFRPWKNAMKRKNKVIHKGTRVSL